MILYLNQLLFMHFCVSLMLVLSFMLLIFGGAFLNFLQFSEAVLRRCSIKGCFANFWKVNLTKVFRTASLSNTCGWWLLTCYSCCFLTQLIYVSFNIYRMFHPKKCRFIIQIIQSPFSTLVLRLAVFEIFALATFNVF